MYQSYVYSELIDAGTGEKIVTYTAPVFYPVGMEITVNGEKYAVEKVNVDIKNLKGQMNYPVGGFFITRYELREINEHQHLTKIYVRKVEA